MSPNRFQCDEIGRNFANCLIFTLAFLHFHPNQQFQNMACCDYFDILKQFDGLTVLDF